MTAAPPTARRPRFFSSAFNSAFNRSCGEFAGRGREGTRSCAPLAIQSGEYLVDAPPYLLRERFGFREGLFQAVELGGAWTVRRVERRRYDGPSGNFLHLLVNCFSLSVPFSMASEIW